MLFWIFGKCLILISFIINCFDPEVVMAGRGLPFVPGRKSFSADLSVCYLPLMTWHMYIILKMQVAVNVGYDGQ